MKVKNLTPEENCIYVLPESMFLLKVKPRFMLKVINELKYIRKNEDFSPRVPQEVREFLEYDERESDLVYFQEGKPRICEMGQTFLSLYGNVTRKELCGVNAKRDEKR